MHIHAKCAVSERTGAVSGAAGSSAALHPHHPSRGTEHSFAGGHISLLYPDSSAEQGVHVHAWGSHLPTANLQAPPEAHSFHALVDADGVLSGHYLADVRMALLLATPPCPSHRARPRLERPFPTLELACSRTTGRTSHEQHCTTISTPTRIPVLRGSGHSESVRSARLLLPGTVLQRGAPCLIPSQHLCLPEHLQTRVT